MRTCAVTANPTTGGKNEEEEVEEEGGGNNVALDSQNLPGVALSWPQQILTYMLLLPVLCTQALWCTPALRCTRML
eukprot:3810100-Pyramimonas_sp.AAC.1